MQGKETGIILLNQDRNVHVINNVFYKIVFKSKNHNSAFKKGSGGHGK